MRKFVRICRVNIWGELELEKDRTPIICDKLTSYLKFRRNKRYRLTYRERKSPLKSHKDLRRNQFYMRVFNMEVQLTFSNGFVRDQVLFPEVRNGFVGYPYPTSDQLKSTGHATITVEEI